MKELHIISILPCELRFLWETYVFLFNLRGFGYSNRAKIVVYIREKNNKKEWEKIVADFPETKFIFYDKDQKQLEKLIVAYNYTPILRLFCMKWLYIDQPELKNDKVFYCDTDIIFTKNLDFNKFLNDDICYLSDTKTYLNSDYFDSKEKDVRDEKKEEWRKIDILNQCCKFAGITREIAEKNKDNTGGAQYILTRIDSKFWEDCINTCLNLRHYLQVVNQQLMKGNSLQEREDNGIQSWCADMLAVQWTLWKNNVETITPKELDFLWATDKINDKSKFIMHNAGINNDAKIRITQNNRSIKDEDGKPIIIEAPAFYKSKYTTITPFDDKKILHNIINNDVSKLYGTALYTQAIINAQKHFNF